MKRDLNSFKGDNIEDEEEYEDEYEVNPISYHSWYALSFSLSFPKARMFHG